MNLQEFRTYPRSYLDLDIDDMPDALIDQWLREGSRRVSRARQRWPFYEATTTIYVDSLSDEYVVLLKEITQIEGPDGQLIRLDESEAQRHYWHGTQTASPARPEAYSVWGGQVRIWPKPDTNHTLTAKGYRYPRDWVSEGAGAEPDMPDDFDDILIAWVMHNAYLQQDEPELSAVQKAKFDEGLAILAKDETAAPTYTPIILNSRRRGGGNGLPSSLRFDGWVEG